ncbi:circularly permuted type 2 ATP-grasp protein [Comamonadaceae bacterium G21597-S1]|nr:circularly permuted type 2 ATP-grasp protein [Comamonadaceae bacterium G21597-S1]
MSQDPTTPRAQAPALPMPDDAPLRPAAAAPGHLDEVHHQAVRSASADDTGPPPMAPHWASFFEHLGPLDPQDLNRRASRLQRQLRDNGVTYNVYADAGGPPRPWSLDLFPLIVTPQSWRQIEAGVLQRTRLLERVMADIYGPQELLREGLIPPALVQGHPGYLRAMRGAEPVGGTRLHIAAFDLAHGPDGNWWLVSQRTQAPSGLGYLLENRIAISQLFPEAFENMHAQRLGGSYRALVDNLKASSPGGRDAHIALLTPGPYNETYFEHAYLARYLGLTLVQGGDMVVRDERLYLKTLRGLVPIHGLLKRMDDAFLDPLELRADSSLGVPGLLQAVRAGNVLMANMPGSAFLESPALLGFLPALSRQLLGEELQLAALPTWWCGERAAMDAALPRLAACAIKPTYPPGQSSEGFQSVLGRELSAREIDEWAGRIALQGDDHTVQAYMPLSQIPTWQGGSTPQAGQIVPRSAMLRVFAVSNGPQSWRVLPGGLARVAHARAEIAAMQRGGSSADVWVMTDAKPDRTTLLAPALTVEMVAQRKPLVTSRAAENLYWLGRYTERTENTIALARLTLECLGGEDQTNVRLLAWLDAMARFHGLVLPDVPALEQSRRVFERSLIASLGSESQVCSVGYNLRAVRQAGSSVRERLSLEHWQLIERAQDELARTFAELDRPAEYGALEALDLLRNIGRQMAAITGAQTDRMTRDDGWRLLSIGRHVERLGFLAASLDLALEAGSLADPAGFEAMLALFDSSISFRAKFQQSREMPALVDLLVLNRDNPRSLAWVAHTLRGRLAKLAGSEPNELSPMSLEVPDPARWSLAHLCTSQPALEEATDDVGVPTAWPHLLEVLEQCGNASHAVSELISATYFTHSGASEQSVGA